MFNNEINIEYIGKHVFDLALQLSLTSEYKQDKTQEIYGYKIHNNSLYLFGYKDNKGIPDFVPFPFAMGLHEIQTFCYGWLCHAEPIGEYPDTDGSVENGFRITTDKCDWRGGSGFYGSVIRIEPIYIVYGK